MNEKYSNQTNNYHPTYQLSISLANLTNCDEGFLKSSPFFTFLIPSTLYILPALHHSNQTEPKTPPALVTTHINLLASLLIAN